MKNIRTRITRINKILMILILVVMVGIIVFLEDGVIAKYILVDTSSEAVKANTFYFSSDYLRDVGNESEISALPKYIVNGWTGADTRGMSFEIRNYENVLLFNDSHQDIIYDLRIDLIDAQTGEIIDIDVNSETTENDTGSIYTNNSETANRIRDYIKKGVLTFSLIKTDDSTDSVDICAIPTKDNISNSKNDLILIGKDDKYNFERYTLNVIVDKTKNNNDAIKENIAILVSAESKTDNIIDNKKLKLIYQLQYTKHQNYIHQQGFVADSKPNEDTYKSLINNQGAINYEIKTADAQNDNQLTDLATKIVCVDWRYNYLNLDFFDGNIDYESVNVNNALFYSDISFSEVSEGNYLNIQKGYNDTYNKYLNAVYNKADKRKNIVIYDTKRKHAFLFFDSLPYSYFKLTFHRMGSNGYTTFNSVTDESSMNTINNNDRYVYATVFEELEQ